MATDDPARIRFLATLQRRADTLLFQKPPYSAWIVAHHIDAAPDWIQELPKPAGPSQFLNQYLGVPHEPDPVYEGVVAVYKDYYDDTERIDRMYHHGPARFHDGAVFSPSQGRDPGHGQRLRNRARLLENDLRRFLEKSDPAMLKQARNTAMRWHERELEPCQCESCRRNR